MAKAIKKKNKSGNSSEKIIITKEVILLIIAILTLIFLVYDNWPTKKPESDSNSCKETMNELQIRFKIDSELKEGSLNSAIKLLYCLEEHENAHTEESVRIIGWCISNDTDCDYLDKAQKIADEIRRTAIRLEQKEKISVERLKKGCLKKF